MKCAICKQEIPVLFLEKIKGTLIRKEGKEYHICFACQKKYPTTDAIKEQL